MKETKNTKVTECHNCPFVIEHTGPGKQIYCTQTNNCIGHFDMDGCFFDGISKECPHKNKEIVISIAE
jgi:hypothetical protein